MLFNAQAIQMPAEDFPVRWEIRHSVEVASFRRKPGARARVGMAKLS